MSPDSSRPTRDKKPDRQLIGRIGEDAAISKYAEKGYTLVARNLHMSHNELDLILENETSLVFVEVKARSYHQSEIDTAPPPGHAVNADKRRFTRQAAKQYLYEHPTRKKPRMDVIEIWVDASKESKRPKALKIHHIKGAY